VRASGSLCSPHGAPDPRIQAVVDLPLKPPAAPEFRMRGREICIPPPRCPPPKPLWFAAMLREDEGAGVLLTELVCQSDWGPTDMLPQPAGSLTTLQAAR
jgi:hypothetical protein